MLGRCTYASRQPLGPHNRPCLLTAPLQTSGWRCRGSCPRPTSQPSSQPTSTRSGKQVSGGLPLAASGTCTCTCSDKTYLALAHHARTRPAACLHGLNLTAGIRLTTAPPRCCSPAAVERVCKPIMSRPAPPPPSPPPAAANAAPEPSPEPMDSETSPGPEASPAPDAAAEMETN